MPKTYTELAVYGMDSVWKILMGTRYKGLVVQAGVGLLTLKGHMLSWYHTQNLF